MTEACCRLPGRLFGSLGFCCGVFCVILVAHAFAKRPGPSGTTAKGAKGKSPSSRPAPAKATPRRVGLVAQGRHWFRKFGCGVCHTTDGGGCLGGTMKGLYGTVAKLEGGRSMRRDASYFRAKIWRSSSLRLADGMNVMPIYKGSISPQQMTAIVAFIRSLGANAKRPLRQPAPRRPHPRATSAPTSRPVLGRE